MNKFLLFLMVMVFSFNGAFAIDWMELKNPYGRKVSLDKDSVIEYKGYYFYNILVPGEKDIVATMQSAKLNPFSAKIKTYSLEEYTALGGDYQNITNNLTQNLEPVTFESTVNTCYKEVVKLLKSKPQLEF